MDKLPTIRNLYRRSAGLNFFRATLGDENGVVDEPGRAGYVRIRYTQAAGLGKATTVRFRAQVQKIVGMPVEVGYDNDGELSVLRADFAAQEATGINPLGNNALDDNVTYFINQSQITTLLSHPVSSASDSMLVTVEPFLYVLDGTLHFFLGGDGDGLTPIDLTAYIPGTSGKQCLACLFLDTSDDTIDVQTSTLIDATDDITTADVQECITNSPVGSIPIHAWRLYNGQTTINPSDLTAGGDNFLDLRQLINVVSNSSAPPNATYITQTANATLTNEQALSSLATGLLRSTTGTGVLSIATPGTHYTTPTGLESLSNKLISTSTLTTPSIASFTNATHNHQNAAGGGTLDAAAIASGTLNEARLSHKFAVIEEQQTSGTDGGASTATTWTTRVLNDDSVDADSIVTILANKFKPIAGVYEIFVWSPFIGSASADGAARIRLYNSTAAAEVARSVNQPMMIDTGIVVTLEYQFTANGTDEYTIDYYVSQSRATNGLGNAVSEASNVERYTRVMLKKIG